MKKFTSIQQIQDHYQLMGKGLNLLPNNSPLANMNHDIHIDTNPILLRFLMSLKGIEAVITYGMAQVFWDDRMMCFGVCYTDGRVDEALHFRDVERIIDEAERHNSYGNLGGESSFDGGEGRESDYARDDDRAQQRN